ncbi:hypothetical protein QZH41_012813, partial [Actinostola sp. cb2023]
MKEVNHYENLNQERKSSWHKLGKHISTVSSWKSYQNSMRDRSRVNFHRTDDDGPCSRQDKQQCKRNAQCVLDSDVDNLGKESFSIYDSFVPSSMGTSNQALVSSRTLIIYFAKLAKASYEEPQEIDFGFLEELLLQGADINFADRHGQTIFHEVARIWNVDVAKFVIENGGDVNVADNYGRTPLHVAAAVDYPEMVEFLVISNDRSDTAKLLIERGTPAGVQDISGSCALSMIISKMPPVAKDALDQFHSTDRANRRQYYYLNYLEPYKLGKVSVDHLMAQLLCGTYIAVSGVILLNLFIALMSDTFQRVYDNAKANAAMQRASTILSMEESMSNSTRDAYRRHFHTRLAPEELYYDDDSTTVESGELERMTHQIKEAVDEVYDCVKDTGNNSTSRGTTNTEIKKLRDDMASVAQRHEN